MTATIDTPADPGAAAAGAARVAAMLATTPETIDGVVAHLEALQEIVDDAYGPRDGVGAFNRLYTRITRGIRAQLDDDLFTDRDFLVRFDVEFARRYFHALLADAGGGTPPRSWGVLLDRRHDRRVSPLELAVVGVNAHVNYDLAPAVVRTCTVLGRSGPGPAERADYRAVNDVFSLHMVRLLDGYDTADPGTVSLSEQLLGTVADVPVVLAREVAWRQALELWELRSRPMAYENEVAALDRRTALLGRGLLTLGALT
ncbi:DUF5995 family protein [Pseudonocardia spirodelae]|uniref:DUF5995 family protein n=1 Tax=Pseudonocardia spirodelae TaxID=3133431 RepID=A0ABU8TDM3_9PSEU